MLSILSPHVRRAAMIGDLLDLSSLNSALYRATLDSLAAPVVLVDTDSRVLYATRPAEAMLSAGSPIARVAEALVPQNKAIAAGFADAIRRTAGDVAVDLGPRGIGLPISARGQTCDNRVYLAVGDRQGARAPEAGHGGCVHPRGAKRGTAGRGSAVNTV
jgi:hypothetical protein